MSPKWARKAPKHTPRFGGAQPFNLRLLEALGREHKHTCTLKSTAGTLAGLAP